MTAGHTNWAIVALGMLVVVIAIIDPGFDFIAIVLGGLLANWGSFKLLAE